VLKIRTNILKGGHRGQALPIVLATLALGIMVIGPLLNHASISLAASTQYQDIIFETYAADAGIEMAISGLSQSGQDNNSNSVNNTYSGDKINGITPEITITELTDVDNSSNNNNGNNGNQSNNNKKPDNSVTGSNDDFTEPVFLNDRYDRYDQDNKNNDDKSNNGSANDNNKNGNEVNDNEENNEQSTSNYLISSKAGQTVIEAEIEITDAVNVKIISWIISRTETN